MRGSVGCRDVYACSLRLSSRTTEKTAKRREELPSPHHREGNTEETHAFGSMRRTANREEICPRDTRLFVLLPTSFSFTLPPPLSAAVPVSLSLPSSHSPLHETVDLSLFSTFFRFAGSLPLPLLEFPLLFFPLASLKFPPPSPGPQPLHRTHSLPLRTSNFPREWKRQRSKTSKKLPFYAKHWRT